MRKMQKIVCVGVAVLGAVACAIEEIGGTVMPLSGQVSQEGAQGIAQRLRAIKARGGISRFVLSAPGHSVRVKGMMDVAGYAEIGRRLRAIKDAVAGDGIDVGYMMLPTMNCGIHHPWRKFTLADGSVREFTACPGDEEFRRDFAAKCAAVDRELHPFAHMFGDDFRYFGNGCFCEDHLRRFSEKTGVKRSRQELVRALKDMTATGDAFRKEWHLFQTEDLKRMAEMTSAAIGEASPETRPVYCAPGRFPEREAALMARLISGRHRPIIRWWGAKYGIDVPVEAAELLHSAQWSRENLGADIECIYEADPCPHTRFYASAARMSALISATTAMGFSAPLFDALSSRADALATSPDYLDMHLRDRERFAAVKRETSDGRLVGVQAVFNPDARLVKAVVDAKHPLDVRAWYRTLNLLGIPVTTAEAPVKLFAGHHAFRGLDDVAITNLLSGGVFLDGAAAEALTARGFAPLIGVKATMRDKIDFAGERATGWSGLKESYPCSFHQNYGLDGCAVSRLMSAGAENVTEFLGKAERQPSITYFENQVGGKVAVMAVNLANCKSPHVFSFAKRDLLVMLFRQLGGDRTVPARIIDRANVMLLANEDVKAGRLFLHATNLSCDPADAFVLEVLPPYAGKSVEILDGAVWRAADVGWNGNRLTVRPPSPVNVYGTLILRLRND